MPMTTKPRRFFYIQWGVSFHRVRRPFDQVFLQVHISSTTMTMASKLGRVVLCTEEFFWIKSQNLLITGSCKVTWQIKYVIFTTTRPLTVKLGEVVSYYRGLSTIKSENPLNMFFEITWQIEIILYPLPQCLKPPKLAALGLQIMTI